MLALKIKTYFPLCQDSGMDVEKPATNGTPKAQPAKGKADASSESDSEEETPVKKNGVASPAKALTPTAKAAAAQKKEDSSSSEESDDSEEVSIYYSYKCK